MSANVFYFTPDKSELNVSLTNIIKVIGYKETDIPNDYYQLLTELYHQALEIIYPQCGFVLLSDYKLIFNSNNIKINEVSLNTERIVASPLKKAKELIIFTSTIGEGFDIWSKKMFESNDPLSGYFVDLLGSEITERVVDWLEIKIINFAESRGKFCSNRYSPGYCGWSVSDQHKLFNYLPENFCGISLTSSSLMKPHKSVSGIIGIGENIKTTEYACDFCKVKHCYKNKNN